MRPSKAPLVPANTTQLRAQLLCSVPAQVDTGLQEWWLARDRKSCAANQPMERVLTAIFGGQIVSETMLGIWMGLLETQVSDCN